VRCAPGEDGTNGFFVCCFVRKPTSPTGDAMPGILGSKRKVQVEPEDQDGINVAIIERKEGGKGEKREKKRRRM
jgi:hypothetical protein